MLLAACAAAALAPAVACAQPGPPVDYHVEAQDLGTALTELARQSGREIYFSADLTRGRRARAVEGRMTVGEALDRLLQGSGLRYRINADGAIAIVSAEGNAGAAVTAAEGEGNDGQAIVVTGSRIRGAASTSPLTTISRSRILESGRARIGDVLQQIPQNFSGGQNPTNIDNNGSLNGPSSSSSASIANLRGLGSDSTLTLINGHRAAFDTISYGVDLSMIPVAAVERIDVLTDGASALYGSDAVAGVVNVILRDDYSGAESQARFGAATRGGFSNLRLSQVVGGNWTGGNLTAGAEYYRADPLTSDERSFSRAAAAPTDLSPRQKDLSLFVNAHQQLGDALTLYATGLYAKRISDIRLTSASSSRSSHDNLAEYDLIAGLRGQLGDNWDFDVSGTLGRSLNHLFATTVTRSTGHSTAGESTNRNGVQGFDLAADGPVLELPSGTVRAALGGGARRESFENLGLISQDSDRRIVYGYLEASIPLVTSDSDRPVLQQAMLSAAARYEHYSDFGAATSPKLGVFLGLLPGLDARASWGRSFRAPTLSELYSGAVTSLYSGSLFGIASPPTATVLIATGSNPNLGAQKASTWTAGLELHPRWLAGAHVNLGHFHIDYKDRIALPITNLALALKDPVYAPFVIPDPSAALQQSYIESAIYPLFNNARAPYDPANVIALLLDSQTNVSRQLARGWDLSIDYGRETGIGRFTIAAGGTWLSLRQFVLPSSPVVTIDGTLFNVPSFKGVATVGWSSGPASVALTVNHMSGEADLATPARVRPWTTADLVIELRSLASSGFLRKFGVQLAATNLFDSDPPYVNPHRNTFSQVAYDAANASPFGRVVSLTVTKQW
jgi:outer membrane receptor protein involved in Fe transport